MEHEQLKCLLSKMSLEEKIDQLIQLAADFYSEKAEERTGPMADLELKESNIQNAGSILGVSGAKESIRIQKEYMANHPLGIPTMFMADIIHGFRTIFPIPLALGSSWDMEAAECAAEISAREAAVSGVHVTFSPMVDLVRDPRWGRVMESTGEDPYLNGCFAKAFVRGYQGENLKEDSLRVASCVKHFAAYGAPEGGREYNTVNMSERELRESYLTGYQAALEAGAKLVMTSFNTVDGMPATGNRWLCREILRKELGFDGVLISDWGSVKELIPHGVAEDEKQAAELAVKAGVDIEMMTPCYVHSLQELVRDGAVKEQLLDEAVLRILELKNDLGLFENPYRGADVEKEKELILSPRHRKASREIAVKSMVLLKNDGILPLKKDEKVALVGPAARSKDILGAWSWKGQMEEAVSLAEGAENITDYVIMGTEYFDYFSPSEKAVQEALELAKGADKVVLALGETEWMSGEAASRSDIRLPEAQIDLFQRLREQNKNIVITLYNGRPLDLTGLEDAKAIVEAWFPGTEGGAALADILWGECNPSGKLSMSFPENCGQIPVYYNCNRTGRPYETAPAEKYVSKYLDVSNYAKYPFGFGLSYSEFVYRDFSLDQTELSPASVIEASVEVENKSGIAGEEIVQLYICDKVGQVVRPVKELKGFSKVRLEAGERKRVSFHINEAMLRYVHGDRSVSSDSGQFDVMVGPNSRDVMTLTFRLTK